jgi:hypothetical protein
VPRFGGAFSCAPSPLRPDCEPALAPPGVARHPAQRLPLHLPTSFIIVTERDHPTVNMLLGPGLQSSENRLVPGRLAALPGVSQGRASSGMQSKAPGSPSAAHALKILPGLVSAVEQNFLSPRKRWMPLPRRPKMVGMADHPHTIGTDRLVAGSSLGAGVRIWNGVKQGRSSARTGAACSEPSRP